VNTIAIVVGALLIAAAIFVAGCKTTAECSAEAVAPLVPRIEKAIADRDSAALAELAAEVGADVFTCAIKEHAKSKQPPVDAGTDGAK
jgi:NADH:ubiquinone oxidoreductase subunit B-like Fe-S oxidoreductase